MEVFLSPFIIVPLVLFLGFCAVIAPMLLPFYIRDEFKDKFESRAEVWQTPYLYQSKWFKPKGVLFQRMALTVWGLFMCVAIFLFLHAEYNK
ncbi:MAG: hypothetical protein RPR97_02180 [Colwellia sp.]